MWYLTYRYLSLNDLVLDLIFLACYLSYIFFSFCDGFGFKTMRKIVWAIYFLIFSLFSLMVAGRFDFGYIIAFSSLLAFVFAIFQRRENQSKGK